MITAEKFNRYVRTKLRADISAGLTVAMVVIPQSMAYAAIAGVNPIHGLFTAIIPAIVGALFGSFPYLVTGPTNPTALVTASVLIVYAQKVNYLEFVIGLAFVAGFVKLLLGFLKAGKITRYISNSVLVGFLSGAGLLIILRQLGNLFGITTAGSGNIWEYVFNIFQNLSHAHILTLAVSLGSFGLMILIQKLNRTLPASLITITVVTIVVYLTGWDDKGIRLVASYGLPENINLSLHLPALTLREFLSLAVPGLAVGLFGLMETVSSTKAMSQMTGEKFDPSREMVGQGLASLIGGLFWCMPSSGSPSRTVLNVVSGAKTRNAAIISGIGVFFFLLIFSEFISYIPIPALAAVVVISSMGFINLKIIKLTWQSRLPSKVVMIFTFISTLIFPLEYAIYLGILSTILIYLGESSRVNLSYLVRTDEGHYLELPIEEIEELKPQVAVVNIEGDLYFAAVQNLQDQIELLLAINLKVLILRFRRTHLLASTGIMALVQLVRTARDAGIEVLFCGLQEEIREPLEAAGVTDIIGESHVFIADHQLFNSTQRALDEANRILERSSQSNED